MSERKQIKIPVPSDFPDIMAAEEKLNSLRQEQARLERRIEGVTQSRHGDGTPTELESAATALLASGKIPAPSVTQSEETVERLRRDLAIVRRAVQLQQEEIQRLYRARSADASLKVLPDYRAEIESAGKCAQAMCEHLTRARAIAAGLREVDLYSSVVVPDLLPHVLLIGTEPDIASNGNIPIGQWLAELRAAGVLK